MTECEYDEDRQDLVVYQAERIQGLEANIQQLQAQLFAMELQLVQAVTPPVPFYSNTNIQPQPGDYSNYHVPYPGMYFSSIVGHDFICCHIAGPPGPSSLSTTPLAITTLMTTPSLTQYNMNDTMYPNDALLRMLLPNPPVQPHNNFPRLLNSTFEL